MNIDTFDELLQAARQQEQPQRLLLVFAGASLPDDASAEQRAAFAAGEGGELAPVMCVDKDPFALSGFETVLEEASAFQQKWILVFAAALSGENGKAPLTASVEAALQRMVDAVRAGNVADFIPFDRSGRSVQLG